jgi:hypothetical protein
MKPQEYAAWVVEWQDGGIGRWSVHTVSFGRGGALDMLRRLRAGNTRHRFRMSRFIMERVP